MQNSCFLTALKQLLFYSWFKTSCFFSKSPLTFFYQFDLYAFNIFEHFYLSCLIHVQKWCKLLCIGLFGYSIHFLRSKHQPNQYISQKCLYFLFTRISKTKEILPTIDHQNAIELWSLIKVLIFELVGMSSILHNYHIIQKNITAHYDNSTNFPSPIASPSSYFLLLFFAFVRLLQIW